MMELICNRFRAARRLGCLPSVPVTQKVQSDSNYSLLTINICTFSTITFLFLIYSRYYMKIYIQITRTYFWVPFDRHKSK
jgi:hypothetical protein